MLCRNIFFPVFLMSGVSMGEWVEITKVRSSSGNDEQKVVTYTPSSYEITLNRPQFYDITGNETEAVVPIEMVLPNRAKIVPNNREDYPIESDYDGNNDYYEEEEEEADNKDDSNEDTSAGVMSLIRHVQDQLLDYKGKSLSAKTEHLKKLRDNMLFEIKYRISQLFKPPKFDSRLFNDDDYEQSSVDYYPSSNEGALMTIGFLTFAVFLIKLVLKLIYAFKLKRHHYYYQTTTTPVSIFLKRHERELDEEQLLSEKSAKLLRYLEEYSPS